MKNLALKKDNHSEPVEDSAVQRSRIGILFYEARSELNISVKTIADKIHVRTLYLEAIEKGEFDRLPSPLYAAGFIRLYARFLNLDGDEILRRLNLAKEYPLSQGPLIHAKASIEPSRFVIVLSILLSLLSLLLVFFVFYGKDKPSEHLVMTDNTTDKEFSLNESELSVEEMMKDVDAKDLLYPLPDFDLESSEEESKAIDKESSIYSTPYSSSSTVLPTRLTFIAHSDCWLELKQNERIIFSSILRKNQHYVLERSDGIVLSTGNAPALEIHYGQKVLPPLSKEHRVIKRVFLDRWLEDELR